MSNGGEVAEMKTEPFFSGIAYGVTCVGRYQDCGPRPDLPRFVPYGHGAPPLDDHIHLLAVRGAEWTAAHFPAGLPPR